MNQYDKHADNKALAVQIPHLSVYVFHFERYFCHPEPVVTVGKRYKQGNDLFPARNHMMKQFVFKALFRNSDIYQFEFLDVCIFLFHKRICDHIYKSISRFSEQGYRGYVESGGVLENLVYVDGSKVGVPTENVVDPVFKTRSLVLTGKNRIFRDQVQLILKHHQNKDRGVQNAKKHIEDRSLEGDRLWIKHFHGTPRIREVCCAES